MLPDDPEFELLGRQASRIDSLDLYLRACRRRGTTDDEALRTYESEVRLYRRRLAGLGPERLMFYARRLAGARPVD